MANQSDSTGSKNRLAAMVLCGGKSTRMGSPKMLLPFGDELLLQRMVRIAGSKCSPVVVVKARQQTLPTLPDQTIVVDDEYENMGPLAGLYSGLVALAPMAEFAFATSCDCPLLKPEFIQFIFEQLADHDMVICKDGKYHHPLAAVYRTSLAPKLATLIKDERLRPIFLMEECDAKVVDVESARNVDPNLDSLRNMNTPDDYRELQAVIL